MPIGDLYLSILDILIVLPLFWAVYRGFMTGFIVEALALAVMLAGLYTYIRVTEIPGVFSENVKQALEYLPVAMFSVAALVAFLLSNLAETYTHKTLSELQKGPIDRSFGAFLSVLRYLVLLSSIVIFIIKLDYKYQFMGTQERNKAVLYYRISRLAPTIFPSLNFRHLENRYMQLVKEGRIQIDAIAMDKIKPGAGGASGEVLKNYTINLDKAFERLAAGSRTFEWHVKYKTKEGTKDPDVIFVEVDITDNKFALEKTAHFRFAIHKNATGANSDVTLVNYKLNKNERSIEEGYQVLSSGNF